MMAAPAKKVPTVFGQRAQPSRPIRNQSAKIMTKARTERPWWVKNARRASGSLIFFTRNAVSSQQRPNDVQAI